MTTAADFYDVGSLWLDTTNGFIIFVCLDAMASAAVWQRLPQLNLKTTFAARLPAPRKNKG